MSQITSSTSEKIILAKNAAGDSANFKIETIVNIDVFNEEKLKSNFIITESFNYDNGESSGDDDDADDARITRGREAGKQ